MPSASPRRQRLRRNVADVPLHEMPLRWHLLAVTAFASICMIVTGESALYHRQPAEQAGPGRIDINFGSQQELESLPGIGPVLAKAIMAARPFSSVEDLVRVRGVGSTQVEKLRPLIKAGRGRRSVDLR
jgi:competence ComEA-like helix-hairpin-helix protein